MNRTQKEIFKQLALMLSKYDLDDIRAALSAFRSEELFQEFVESAARVSRTRQSESGERTSKKSAAVKERLARIEDEVATNGSEEQRIALSVAKKILDRRAFSGAPEIRRVFGQLNVSVAKSTTDRNALVLALYSTLSGKEMAEIRKAEQILTEHHSGSSSLLDWSKLINRGESGPT